MAHRVVSATRLPTRSAAGPPAGSVTDDDRRRQQTTDASEQNNTGILGGPIMIIIRGRITWLSDVQCRSTAGRRLFVSGRMVQLLVVLLLQRQHGV